MFEPYLPAVSMPPSISAKYISCHTYNILLIFPTPPLFPGVYEFHPKYWDKVSEEAKDLIRKLLVIDPLNRLTVEQVCVMLMLQLLLCLVL